MSSRLPLEARLEQVDRDLEELSTQMATGEIDETTGARLRNTYAAERKTLLGEMTVLPAGGPTRSPRRMVVGGAVLVVALAVSVGLAGSFVQERDDGPLVGVTNDDFDLDTVTNEQMEAVIAAYADDPAVAEQLPRMRFRLGERYFSEGDFEKAFRHYDAVIRSEVAAADVVAVSLTRVAWMVWLQQQDPTLALDLIERSLVLAPGHPETLYVKGQLLWCGAGDAAGAIPLFEAVMASDSLPDDVFAQVEADLLAARAGEPC